MYTINGAWVAHDENSRGSIEVGKFADLVVLDRDYLTVPIEEIANTKVLLTMVGGRIVHAAGPYLALQDEQ
jgi:predicted amidohydrolase YtcJ